MLNNKTRELRSEDFVVRPTLRVLGALLLGFLTYLFVANAQKVFYLSSIGPEQCRARKGRIFCELGNWITSITPASMQGPLAAAAHIGMALIFVWAMWMLLKPLVTRSRSK
jgi:hypothetical protein